jgi:chemotaxis protein methyltransferase WspC
VKRIESLLSREIGLNARSIGMSAIEAAVKTRLRARGTPEISEYLVLLQRDALERSALVEEIVVSETWFFRDEEVFKTLRRHAASCLSSDRGLRVLSLPCATGEEAYSVAMTLLEAGMRTSRFSVRGVDVSQRALELARAAVYGKNSFRGGERAQHGPYFEATAGGWRVLDEAREPVSFSKGNVLDSTTFSAGSFDVILCRNLLIYLDPQARARALDNLFGWLADDGLLFAGHAEAVELMDARFQKLAESSHFTYVKPSRPRPARAPLATATARAARASKAVVRQGRKPSPNATGSALASPVADSQPRAPRASLEHAVELANRGSLQDAQRLCERVVAEAGASPEAYCLLGIISNAAGNREGALAYFTKSLYLDQNHHEALVHLALLHEQRGEHPAAANFRRRAERARRGESK